MDFLQQLGLNGGEAEENAVTYALYLDAQGTERGAGGEDAKTGTQAGALRTLQASCFQLLLPHLTGYIWQRDRFELRLSTEDAPPWTHNRPKKGAAPACAPDPPCLWGTVRFGDNIEDEWFVVWLLLELTRRRADVTAKVYDNDGEFLLIEAAYALPRWVKPESARNRVWLRAGAMHLLPPPSSKHPDLPASPSVTEALLLLASGRVTTLLAKVQAPIEARLAGYPAAARSHMHRARAQLPASVARVLAAEPQLVTRAVDAFCHRDVEDMRTAGRMRRFPPADLTAVLVVLNRCQYAQLAQQRFEPPRGYPVPPTGHPLHKAADLGLKLTAGFEIMYAHSSSARRAEGGSPSAPAAAAGDAAAAAAAAAEPPVPPTGKTVPVEQQAAHHPGWTAYQASLERLGYFQGNIPGSARHRSLLSVAARDFVASVEYGAVTARLSQPADRVDEVLLAPAGPLLAAAGAEDDDSWLEAQAGDLEAELQRRTAEVDSQNAGAGAARGAPPSEEASGEREGGTQEVDAAELAGPLRGFVEYLSAGLEGAEVPRGRDDGGVGLNPDAFLAELERVLGGGGMGGGRGGGGTAGGTGRAGGLGARPMAAEEGVESASGDETSEEGSSFFSDDEDRSSHESDEDDEEEDLAEAAGGVGSGGGVQPNSSAPAARHGGAAAAPAGSKSAGRAGTSGRAPPSAVAAAARKLQEERWEACTATDSDDDGGASGRGSGSSEEALDIGSGEDEEEGAGGSAGGGGRGFMDAYAREMEEQLQGTKMTETFERSEGAAAPAAGTRAGPAGAGASAPAGSVGGAEEGGQEEEEEGELRPIDMDMNLVKNLIRSYTSQQGMPGPAGSLAALMGIHLPRGEVE